MTENIVTDFTLFHLNSGKASRNVVLFSFIRFFLTIHATEQCTSLQVSGS